MKFLSELADAKKQAAGSGHKLYVTKGAEITRERPKQSEIMYEVYPGGRVIGWGLADRYWFQRCPKCGFMPPACDCDAIRSE